MQLSYCSLDGQSARKRTVVRLKQGCTGKAQSKQRMHERWRVGLPPERCALEQAQAG